MQSSSGRFNLVSTEGQAYPIAPGRTTMGRNPENQIVVSGQYVSRTHAAIDFDGQQATLTDLGSTHGTALNGQRVLPHRPHPLEDGDRVVLAGEVGFTVRGAASPQATADRSKSRTSPFVLALGAVTLLLLVALVALVILYLQSPGTSDPAPGAVATLPTAAELGTSNLYIEYILDASGSMNESLPDGTVKLAVAQKLLAERLQAFRPETHIGLRAYGHRVHYEQREESCRDIELIAPVDVGQLSTIVTWLQGFQAQGMTPLAQSIRLALNDFAFDPARINTIVMLSDGIETCEGDPCGLVRELKVEGVNFTIHVIGLDVDEPTRQQLQCIAEAGEGTYHDASSEEELEEALEAIQEEVTEGEVVVPPGVDTPTPTPTSSATPAPPAPAATQTSTAPPPSLTPPPPTATSTPIPPTVTSTPIPPTATHTPSSTPSPTPTVPPAATSLSIAFFSDRDTPGYGEIYLMNPDGSGQRRLTSSLRVPPVRTGAGPGVTSFDWSTASEQFLYSQGSGAELYSVGIDGGQKVLLSRLVGSFAISPNGKRIALQTLNPSPPQIATMNIDGAAYGQITNDPDYQLGHPTWSPDGGRIAYARNAEYWVVSEAGGKPNRLVAAELVPGLYECSWSPDGRRLACNTLASTPALYLVDIDSQNAKKITDNGGWTPTWSPDGKQIAFYKDQIWVIDSDGSDLRQLTSQGKNCCPIWVPGP